MKTLFYGAGPLGSLYAHLLYKAGKDVTILARNERYEFLKENGIVLVNAFTGEKAVSRIRVVDRISNSDQYDTVVVLIRKNKLGPVIQDLSHITGIRNFLFMGNNVTGFADYMKYLPAEKLHFGFPGAGGSYIDQIVHYVDSARPGGRRLPISLGKTIDQGEKTDGIIQLFESSGIPVRMIKDMDGWLKYHAALILPIAFGLYKHDCDNHALAQNRETLRLILKACKEGGNMLKDLGYRQRQPYRFNYFYWLPEFIIISVFRKLFDSRFAEIGLTLHARSAMDEMRWLHDEFRSLINKSSVKTPVLDLLSRSIE